MQSQNSDRSRTAAAELASLILERPIEEWIAERRAAGRAWRRVERDLLEATGGRVDVTHETLRTWAPDQPAGRARVTPRSA